MTKKELFDTLQAHFRTLVLKEEPDAKVHVKCRGLSPKEAVGETDRKDLPILNGEEVMIQAEVDGYIGQAFTATASFYEGTLRDVMEMEIVRDSYNRAIFIAVMNALMRKYGECDRTIHCKNKGPNECAKKTRDRIRETFGRPKILEVGYQPFLLDELSQEFPMRILDLNPENIGQVRYGVLVEDGGKVFEDAIAWADLILCTSSTLGNGTIVNYMDLNKPIWFYGTTGCCATAVFGLERSCYAD